MSRLSTTPEYTEESDGIENVIEDFKEKPNKVILFDLDSTIHECLYSGRDEFGNKNPEYTEEDLEYLYGKLSEMILKVFNSVEKYFNPLIIYLFIKGNSKGFRKELYPLYKSHRQPPNPIINKLYEYVKVAHNAIEAEEGLEADDMIAIVSNKIDNQGVIVGVDKDLKFISGIHYNYRKNLWCKVSEQETLYNFYRQLVIGDSADHIPGAFRVGEKWVDKNMQENFTKEKFEEVAFQAYLKAAKNDEEKAKSDMELNRQLITLKIN